jgi:antitoxin component YwqK of YwqJK toxin-antitoxin module
MNQIINGLREGPWEQYYDNGQLHYRGFYMNSKFYNFCECYTKDGNLNYKGNFIKNIPIGFWEIGEQSKEFHL